MPSPSTTFFKRQDMPRYSFNQSSGSNIHLGRSGAGHYAAGKPVASQKKSAAPQKTSAYLGRYRANNKTSQFWNEVTRMAEKANRVENIDNRRNPCDYTGPATSLKLSSRRPSQEATSYVRGQGGI